MIDWWTVLVYYAIALVIGFLIGFQWKPRYPKLPALHVGSIIQIDDKYFRLQSYETASGGVMDISTVYTFVDMTLTELDEHEIKRPKYWRKGKNGRLC